MTKREKNRLRLIMLNRAHEYTDEQAARACNCTTATAGKYRKALAQ